MPIDRVPENKLNKLWSLYKLSKNPGTKGEGVASKDAFNKLKDKICAEHKVSDEDFRRWLRSKKKEDPIPSVSKPKTKRRKREEVEVEEEEAEAEDEEEEEEEGEEEDDEYEDEDEDGEDPEEYEDEDESTAPPPVPPVQVFDKKRITRNGKTFYVVHTHGDSYWKIRLCLYAATRAGCYSSFQLLETRCRVVAFSKEDIEVFESFLTLMHNVCAEGMRDFGNAANLDGLPHMLKGAFDFVKGAFQTVFLSGIVMGMHLSRKVHKIDDDFEEMKKQSKKVQAAYDA